MPLDPLPPFANSSSPSPHTPSIKTIEDFRDGPFSMDISEVGFYSEENVGDVSPSTFPVMSNTTKSSFGRSVLGPVFKLVFSEKSRRR